ncbi:MAG TPA: ABC transporter substrate-binding protein, partial [Acidobacteriota bacterium]|nr:ABC transporter substrate-binding protein [Acidobacteriota bacterium]
LAERIGEQRNGERLTLEIGDQIQSVQEQVSRISVRPRVLMLIGRNQGSLTDIYAVGPNSFLGELIRLAGGINVFADTRAQYPKVSIEAILYRKPDIIIDLSYGQPDSRKKRAALQLWRKFPGLAAVKSNRVFTTSNDIFLLPGPRIGEAVKELARMIHGIDF